jgi:hypothetical protein
MALYLINVFHILRITHCQSGVKTSEVLFPSLPNMEEREFGTELNSKCNFGILQLAFSFLVSRGFHLCAPSHSF